MEIPRLAALVALLLVLPSCVLSAVHPYTGQRFFQKADAWLFRGGREGLFSSTPYAQAHWLTVAKGVANGKAYVRYVADANRGGLLPLHAWPWSHAPLLHGHDARQEAANRWNPAGTHLAVVATAWRCEGLRASQAGQDRMR